MLHPEQLRLSIIITNQDNFAAFTIRARARVTFKSCLLRIGYDAAPGEGKSIGSLVVAAAEPIHARSWHAVFPAIAGFTGDYVQVTRQEQDAHRRVSSARELEHAAGFQREAGHCGSEALVVHVQCDAAARLVVDEVQVVRGLVEDALLDHPCAEDAGPIGERSSGLYPRLEAITLRGAARPRHMRLDPGRDLLLLRRRDEAGEETQSPRRSTFEPVGRNCRGTAPQLRGAGTPERLP